jgi:hypothetical protein
VSIDVEFFEGNSVALRSWFPSLYSRKCPLEGAPALFRNLCFEFKLGLDLVGTFLLSSFDSLLIIAFVIALYSGYNLI